MARLPLLVAPTRIGIPERREAVSLLFLTPHILRFEENLPILTPVRLIDWLLEKTFVQPCDGLVGVRFS